MAGIKETKDQLQNEILELYKRFTATKPELIFSGADNKGQLLLHAELASALAKKIEALAYLASVEEEKPVTIIVPPIPVPEMKAPGITFSEIIPPPVVPTVEVKVPEMIPQPEKIVPPPVAEIKKPEVIVPPTPAGKVFPDIKTFIGLNEKLMFVRSLFKGNGTDYENAIAEVNNCTSYKEAEAVLQNFSGANNWSQDAEPVQVLYSIVKRRFA